MTFDVVNTVLISASIINIFVMATFVIKKKINIAIGLGVVQALAWSFKLMGLF